MKIGNKVVKNASWIIAGKIVQSVLALIVNMLTARYLGPSNYGVISYAASIIAFILPVTQLGISNVLVQELTDKPEEEGKILGTSILMNLASALGGVVCVVCFCMAFNSNDSVTNWVCIVYSISLVFQASELIQYWYQAKLLSKYNSIVSLFAYIIVSAYKIFLLSTQQSVILFALSVSMDYAIISLILIFIYRKLGGEKFSFSSNVAKRILKKSKHYILSTMMVVIYAQTDKIMLKFYLDESATGIYTAAVNIAGMSSFLFSAIIDSIRPAIFSYKKQGLNERFENSICSSYSIVIYLALLQSVFMTVFSSFIVSLLYGDAYSDAATVLKIVVWYTTFSYIGLVRNIWILAEEKQKYLWIINLSGAVLNIVINAILIPICGTIGAAIASLITQCFANVIIGFLIKPIIKNNMLLIKGINPKKLINVFLLIKNRRKEEK